MKTQRLLALLLCMAGFSVSSIQAASGLALKTHSGLTITGAVGAVYAIQATTNVAQSNSWTCLTFVRLPATNHFWFDPSPNGGGQRFYRTELTFPSNMVFIPPGTFLMGSGPNESGRFTNEGPRVRVTLTKGFFIGEHEVTQQEYSSVMNVNPSFFTPTNSVSYNTNQPVETVMWSDATNYCGRLTLRERAAGRIPIGSRFRLPTEAEWEYACRADFSTRFNFGPDICPVNFGELPAYAWYKGNNDSQPRAIKQLAPNAWELYDMHGNVWEWCQDRFGTYAGGEAIDPQGATTGTDRVLRGGSFAAEGRSCRSACRLNFLQTATNEKIGFRVVLSPAP
jgi:formylglycine-generating enzyme required for sulfatase activity